MDDVLVQFIHANPGVPISLRARSKSKDLLLYMKTRYCAQQQIVPSTTKSYVTLETPSVSRIINENVLDQFINQTKITCVTPRSSPRPSITETTDEASSIPSISMSSTPSMSSVKKSSSKLIPTLTSVAYRYKINLIMTGLICPPDWEAYLSENLFMAHLCKIFGAHKTYKYKVYTDAAKTHSKMIITHMFMFNHGSYSNYHPLHFIPTLEFKHVDMQNKSCLIVNFDFGFYCNDFMCLQQLFFKLFYKYQFDLFSCMIEDDEYMTNVEQHLLEYRQQKLAIVGQEIIFSPPTLQLKQGGIQYRQAHDSYYTVEHHSKPIISSLHTKKSKPKIQIHRTWRSRLKHYFQGVK